MSGHWSQTDNDWLVFHHRDLTKALNNFIALVNNPPLMLSEANQALISITARLVCYSYFLDCSYFSKALAL